LVRRGGRTARVVDHGLAVVFAVATLAPRERGAARSLRDTGEDSIAARIVQTLGELALTAHAFGATACDGLITQPWVERAAIAFWRSDIEAIGFLALTQTTVLARDTVITGAFATPRVPRPKPIGALAVAAVRLGQAFSALTRATPDVAAAIADTSAIDAFIGFDAQDIGARAEQRAYHQQANTAPQELGTEYHHQAPFSDKPVTVPT
jgi:hypothetical protein